MKYKLIFYDSKDNKYSLNALLGALEGSDSLKDLEILLMDDNALENLVSQNEKNDFYIFCVSFFTTQIFKIKDLVNKLKERFKERITLIAGGPHPTGDPKSTLKIGFDIVVRGEGENIFPKILQDILSGKAIKGIFLNSDLIDLDKYFPFSRKFSRFGPIEISRGCPFGCFYCQTPQIFGRKMRHRSIEYIVEIVEEMVKRNLKDIRFITPNAFSYGSPDGKSFNIVKLEELLSRIKKIIGKEGRIFFGSFPSEVRPEHVTPETLELVKVYANNDNLVIGAQSGSQKILDLCHRGHKVEDIYRAVELTISYGLRANVDFIFGLPYEEEEDINETVKLIEELIKLGAKVHAHTFMPLPGTPFSKFPPGKIKGKYKDVVNKLLPKGVIFGNFREQEKIAWEIYEYFSREE